MFKQLVPYVSIENFHASKKIIYDKLYFSLLLFRVRNHVFHCCKSHYENNMCLFCTKLHLRNKKTCKLIEKKLTIDVLDFFPVELTYDVISDEVVNLFVHSTMHDRQKRYSPNNFGTLFYEVISSPFILWKFYLDVLASIVLNYYDKHIISVLLSGWILTNAEISLSVVLCVVLG